MTEQENSEEIEGVRVIRIGNKGVEKYLYTLVKALVPYNYEKFKEIKVQVAEKNLPIADAVLGLLTSLWIDVTNKEKKKVEAIREDGSSYPLEIIEITLEKHPKLRR